jgi:hypothetical protein
MPINVKRRADKDAPADAAEAGEGGTFSLFMLRPNWFSLDQTDGDEFIDEEPQHQRRWKDLTICTSPILRIGTVKVSRRSAPVFSSKTSVTRAVTTGR